MKTRKEIKAEARDILGHQLFGSKWLMVLVILLISGIFIGVCGVIPIVGTIVALILIAGAINYGVCKTLLKTTRREVEEANFDNLFDGFKEAYAGSIGLFIIENIFIFLWSLLLIIPGIVKSYSYSQAMNIKADNPNKTWKECIDESRQIMNGHKWSLFVQHLSFIGWYIVGALCLGIGVLWVDAYRASADTIFYNELIGYKKKVDVLQEADTVVAESGILAE